MVVCGCFNMTKEQIIEEYKATGSTQAGTGCGGCKPQVDAIIASIK